MIFAANGSAPAVFPACLKQTTMFPVLDANEWYHKISNADICTLGPITPIPFQAGREDSKESCPERQPAKQLAAVYVGRSTELRRVCDSVNTFNLSGPS